MFVSTIPLKVEIDEKTTFEDLSRKFSIDTRKALRHQRYPYLKMLEIVRKGSSNVNNLFKILISFQNIKPDKNDDSKNVEQYWIYNEAQQSQFEMHISQYDIREPFTINFDFKEDIANREEQDLIIDRFIYLIDNIADKKENNNLLVEEIEYIPKKELKYIHKMSEPSFKTKIFNRKNEALKIRFEKIVKKYPNNIAVKYEESFLTYNELNQRANILAHNLMEKGINDKDAICILLNRSVEMAISIIASIKLGAHFIPIATDWPEERIKYIIKNSESKIVITDEAHDKDDYGVENINVKDLLNYNLCDKYKFENIEKEVDPQNPLYILYTSGSTGKPKGVLINNENVSGFLNGMLETYDLKSDDIWAMFHAYTFDVSMWEFFGSLLTGASLIIVPDKTRFDAKKMLYFLRDEKITILSQTPSYFYKLVVQDEFENLKEEDINLRYIVLGGESVYAEPIKPWMKKYKKTKIMNGYGPTEATIYIATGEITKDDIENEKVYIGRPVTGDSIYIKDKNNNLLPIGCKGELYMSGVGIGSGYFKDEEKTKAAFILDEEKRIYKSGDIGYYNPDGRITCLGRNDSQIKIRGFRVEIQEIEKALLSCDDVTRAAVMAVNDKNYTKKLVAFIETQKEDYVDDVIAEISKTLTPYMIPELYQLKEFPINTSGKIDRRELLNKAEELKENINKELVEPINEIEEEILKTIKRITRKRKVSTTDDFFHDLNLDSLDLMSMATNLSKYNITVQDINDTKNIKALSERIIEKTEGIDFSQKDTKLEEIDIHNKKVVFDLSNVLLTGVTGFLGAHILRELLNNDEVKKIYCLIREKNDQSIEQRFENIKNRYFVEADYSNLNKIELVNGDFEKQNLNLAEKDYDKLKNTITTIIHAGANVKHFGDYDASYTTNVVGVKNIIEFAKDSRAGLAHISTMSVGGMSKIDDIKEFDENMLYINQIFLNNVYLQTKYQAEVEIIKANNDNLINAKIFRLGNIMPRESDGVFQPNIVENAFLNKIRTCIQTKMIPEVFTKMYFELTPVDKAAKAITTLLKDESIQTVYNIKNNKLISINQIIENSKINFQIVDSETQIKKIQELNDPRNAILLANLQTNNIVETHNNSTITNEILNKYNFEWDNLNQGYLDNILCLSDF